ncbi:MAG: DUF2971 domain-containing protein [Pseudohongiella sp.]|nr:DUF2971 domain-containing protein [Pseudohongiella sp.]
MTNFGHYTSISGIKGILEVEELWATNIKFLNDEHEFQHAIDLFKEVIPKAKITKKDRNYDLYAEYGKRIIDSLNSLNNYKSESVFTLSFSEETDLLSQWRGYCPNHNGYCLVFDVPKIYDSIVFDHEDVYFENCVYDDDEKDKKIKSVLNDRYSEYIKCDSEKMKDGVIGKLTRDMLKLAAHFKHSSFREEKEHRIIVVQDYAASKDTRFRVGRTSLIPYVSIPVKKEHLKKVVIGPTENKGLAQRALQSFVEKIYGDPFFLLDIEIEFSKSPYRPW